MIRFSRSTFYYNPVELSAEDKRREIVATKKIQELAAEFPRYGYKRMTQALRREGIVVNHKMVYRIMGQKQLLCKRKRRFVMTTDSNHSYTVYPNLIKQLEVVRINQVWIADITYVGIENDFVYLACILDAYSRRAIGYAISMNIDAQLTLAALKMAVGNRKILPGIIHHSDRGSQYACHEYVDLLKISGFKISMSRTGNPYDNAKMESFIKTVKYEEVYLWGYETIEDVQNRIPYFIEEVYNKKRLHSSIGYVPPNEFEESISGQEF